MSTMAPAERTPPTDTGRCGEPAGYGRHRRRGEHPCRPCTVARTAQIAACRPRRTVGLSAQGARPLSPMQVFGRIAGRGLPHGFQGPDISQCEACWGWRDDPRHL